MISGAAPWWEQLLFCRLFSGRGGMVVGDGSWGWYVDGRKLLDDGKRMLDDAEWNRHKII